VSIDPDMGELRPDTAAELEAAVIGHRMDNIELEAATGYREAVIFRAASVMRANDCTEDQIATMAAEERAKPLAKWVKALRGSDDFGPWCD
jgi:hypothetical protein